MTTFGSLFAGAGGFDLGFESAGWECRWQVEKDPKALDVLAYHWPDVARFDDVCTVTNLEPVDVIVGGFPCQDLSVAGQRAGMVEGTRSGLFFEFIRIVKDMRGRSAATQPRYAIWENVPGLLTLGDTLGNIYSAWDEIGAMVQEHRVVDARFFGVPQRRTRVIGVVSFDPRSVETLPILADSPSMSGNHKSLEQTRQTTTTIAPVGAGGSDSQYANNEQASSLTDLTYRLSSYGEYKPDLYSSCIGTKEHRNLLNVVVTNGLAEEKDCNTQSCEKVELGQVEGVSRRGVRQLSPLECERLMGWPDNHTSQGISGKLRDGQRYRLIGNGVVAPVAEWTAERVTQNMEEL